MFGVMKAMDLNTPDPVDPHAHVEALMDRARNLLGFLTPEAAAEVLMSSGVTAGEAFLTVTAATLLSVPEAA